MATETKKLRYIIIAVAAVVVIGIVAVLLVMRSNTKKPAEVLFREYQELESAYSKALSEIEKVSDSDFQNLEEMKKQLQLKLKDLNTVKGKIDLRHQKSDELYADLKKNVETLNFEVKDTVKNTDGEVTFNTDAGEVVLSTQQVSQIFKDNAELKKQNDELAKDLALVRNFFEKEKAKNVTLNTKVTEINSRLEKLQADGTSRDEEIKKLKEEREQYAQELEKSNTLIQKQNKKLNEYVAKLRKATLSCYYVYEKGNVEKETKIALTEEGLSRMYLEYFTRTAPSVVLQIDLNEEFFKGAPEKVTIRINSERGAEMFSTTKLISKPELKVEVSGKTFTEGVYLVEVRSGTENLLAQPVYKFKLGK